MELLQGDDFDPTKGGLPKLADAEGHVERELCLDIPKDTETCLKQENVDLYGFMINLME